MVYGAMLVLFITLVYFRYEQRKINDDLYNNDEILAKVLDVEIEYEEE